MITIEIKGPSGSGKSAIAQAIVMLLTEAGLSVGTDSKIDMRSEEGLAKTLNALKQRKVCVDVYERQCNRRRND